MSAGGYVNVQTNLSLVRENIPTGKIARLEAVQVPETGGYHTRIHMDDGTAHEVPASPDNVANAAARANGCSVQQAL